MITFGSIPIRANGSQLVNRVVAAWFNALRLAGITAETQLLAGPLVNIGFNKATTTDADDSLKIQGSAAALSATNILYINIQDPSNGGRTERLTATADVTIKATGATFGAPADLPNATLYVYAISDGGALKWGLHQAGDLTDITDVLSSATPGDVNLSTEMLVNTTLTVGTHPVRRVGSDSVIFDLTGGASEKLWGFRAGVSAFVVGLEREFGHSEIVATTASGHGSGSTRIRRLTVQSEARGDAIDWADDSVLGTTFLINRSGMYYMSFVDASSVTGEIGISKNSSQLTTGIRSITAADRVALSEISFGGGDMMCSAVVRLNIGDVLRPHTDATPDAGSIAQSMRVVRIGD